MTCENKNKEISISRNLSFVRETHRKSQSTSKDVNFIKTKQRNLQLTNHEHDEQINMFNPIKETKHALNLNLDSQPTSPPSYKIEQIKKQVNKIAMLKSSSTSKSIKEVKKNNEFEKAYHQASMQNHPIINIENQSKEKFVHK